MHGAAGWVAAIMQWGIQCVRRVTRSKAQNRSIFIMSDLAKFVAATLKEKVAVDLEEENEQLHKKNEKLEAERAAERTKALEYASRNGTVEITGKGGSPVYARGEMTRAEYIDEVSLHEHELALICDDPTLCPITKVTEAEIRLNGLVVSVLSETDSSDALSTVGDEHTELYFLFEADTHGVGGLWGGRKIVLHMTFGPVPDPDSVDAFDIDTDFRDEQIREVRFTDFHVDLFE